MRYLCFGGSFNPIHHGHLICARAVAEGGGFDRVVLIPSGQPPHKTGLMDMAAASHRLDMCRIAIENDPLFEVDDVEIARAGPSYTIDTARQLRARGWIEIIWLIGADMALSLPTWHQSVTLLSEVKFLAIARPGSDLDLNVLAAPYKNAVTAGAVEVVVAPEIDISSSQIRRRVSASQSINYLTPQPVVQYIYAHDLYKSGT